MEDHGRQHIYDFSSIQTAQEVHLLEIDSPGSRLDGAVVVQEVVQQECQVFLNELRMQEKKFEEKFPPFEEQHKQQLQRLKLGMGNNDQRNSK